MEWWQTLLIGLCPSILSTIVAIVVPVTQSVSAKKERLAKYESDKKQHVSRKRLDMEFEIYKELSEKVMALVSQALILFENIDIDGAHKQKDKTAFMNAFDKVSKLHNEANIAINKHAIFIPEKWYKKFLDIKVLCLTQLEDFDKYIIQDKWEGKTSQDIKKLSATTNRKIGEVFNELVSGLRTYLTEFGSSKSVIRKSRKASEKLSPQKERRK